MPRFDDAQTAEPPYSYTISGLPRRRPLWLLTVVMVWVSTGPILAVAAAVAIERPATTVGTLATAAVAAVAIVAMVVRATGPSSTTTPASLAAGAAEGRRPAEEPSRPYDGDTSFAPPSRSLPSLRALPGRRRPALGNSQTVPARPASGVEQ